MSLGSGVGQFFIAAVLMAVLDLLWLGVLANGFYERVLGDMLATQKNGWAAAVFYVIYVAGLVYLVVAPAIADDSLARAALGGAVLGLLAYATWNLTNLAVLSGFPARIVPVDMAWGTFLTAAVSTGTYLIWSFFAS